MKRIVKRWHTRSGKYIKSPKEIEIFLMEIEAVCRRNQMSIGHEDGQGAFLIKDFSQENIDWLRDAFDARTPSASEVPPP